MRKVAVAAVLFVSACAPKTVPLATVTTPAYPELSPPSIPAALANSPATGAEDRGWRFLQTGDVRSAEREFLSALKADPGFYPADISLGYIEMVRKDPKAALSRFEAALAADPSLTDIARRVDVLRFRTQQGDLAAAREAARAGHPDEAIRLYSTAIAASPDSAFLYRELAEAEMKTGAADVALDHLRKAVALDPGDSQALVAMGGLLEVREDFDDAAKAYADALALEPGPALESRLESVRSRAALAHLPDDYRAIGGLAQITRGDLAALIGVRLAPLIQAGRRRDAVLVTDSRNHWAATWIVAVARAGIMDPYANHGFSPRAVVRRVDLAQAVSRLLVRVQRVPNQARPWDAARLTFSDLSPGHLAYIAASQAVASGAMTMGAGGGFEPSRAVTGAEALETVGRIEVLAGLAPSGAGAGSANRGAR